MRKIIHIDMDCFYAAIEERENPSLRGKPVGVGGHSRRSVLTTANYPARRFGCRSAMPVYRARELCPALIVIEPRFDLYRQESRRIRAIFARFTEIIEPLSLDEAYLDVSHLRSGAGAVAREIRAQIFEETGLTASAGIGPNKLLAKIASDWNKPNGQHEVTPDQVKAFLEELPVGRLWGVGPKMRARLNAAGFHVCGDLRRCGKLELVKRFGSGGLELHELACGLDEREVNAERVRKSISCEQTFEEDLCTLAALRPPLQAMAREVAEEVRRQHGDRAIRSLVVKVKFADFTGRTAERAGSELKEGIYEELLRTLWTRGGGKPVRLLGAGVRFRDPEDARQLELF